MVRGRWRAVSEAPFSLPSKVKGCRQRQKAPQGEEFQEILAEVITKQSENEVSVERICSTRLNDRFPLQDSANCLIRIESASCCGANDRSNGSEKIGAPV